MFMGFVLIAAGLFLYFLVKPPVPNNSTAKENLIFPSNVALDSEARLDV